MKWQKLPLIIARVPLPLRENEHRDTLLHGSDRAHNTFEVLADVILYKELAVQPLHPDRKDRHLLKVALGHERRDRRQLRISQNHIKVAPVVPDKQHRSVLRNILKPVGIQPDAAGQLYHPEAKLHHPEACPVAERRPFFPEKSQNSQIRQCHNQIKGRHHQRADCSQHLISSRCISCTPLYSPATLGSRSCMVPHSCRRYGNGLSSQGPGHAGSPSPCRSARHQSFFSILARLDVRKKSRRTSVPRLIAQIYYCLCL